MRKKVVYTEEMIIKRLEEAAETMRKLPPVKVQGYVSTWPEMLYSTIEKLQMERKNKKTVPTPEQIERMEETCRWLRFIYNIEDRRLVWLRAERVRWKFICKKFGIGRSALNERWKNGLRMILFRLTQTC